MEFNVVQNISVYPNPAAHNIMVYGLNGTETLVLHHISGQQQLHVKATDSNMQLEVNHLVPGIYILTVTDTSGAVLSTYKIVKQ